MARVGAAVFLAPVAAAVVVVRDVLGAAAVSVSFSRARGLDHVIGVPSSVV